MARQNLRESEPHLTPNSISEDASDWIGQFIRQLEVNFVDECHKLPRDPELTHLQDATVGAVWQTLLDSGMDDDSILETIERSEKAGHHPIKEWSAALNQRRFELIDKDIQHLLTAAERVELVGLTRRLREQLDSATNLPEDGAKELHQRLLDGRQSHS